MIDALEHLLRAPPCPAPIDGVDGWWSTHQGRTAGLSTPLERALVGGFVADRLGWAFASGYTEALVHLVPGLRGRRAALCATEGAPGAPPRSIETRLEEREGALRVEGSKGFVTLGTHAERLLVVAARGVDEQGRPRLVVVDLPADRAGVTVTALPAMPFVPELPHARLELDHVALQEGEILPGDGYLAYLKPFRTIEDIHVHAALLGYLIQIGRRCGLAQAHLDELITLACALAPLAAAPALAPATHVALGALLARATLAITSLDDAWEKVEPAVRERWLRDRPLLGIAGRARARRLEVARERLAGRPVVSSTAPSGAWEVAMKVKSKVKAGPDVGDGYT